MAAPLTFEIAAQTLRLPENYMPAGLAALRGDPGATGRMLLDLRDWGDAIDFDALTAAQIGSLDHWAVAPGADPGPDAIFCLGQPLETAHPRRRCALRRTPAAEAAVKGGGRAVVVIDHGIAFWNGRFRRGRGAGAPSRFREVQFLSFQDPGADDYQVTVLDSAAIDALCVLADGPGGQHRVLRRLAALVPASFYGSGASAEGVWHGTAMADLAAGADPNAPDDRLLYGVEVPTAALRDWGGDTLQTMLLAALAAALRMVEPAPDAPGPAEVVILLAFGFPAGPQDGSHPAADLLRRCVAEANRRGQAAGRRVRLVLPAGNHLQDACHARLPAAVEGAALPSVGWRVAPDDNSPNTVEICLHAAADPLLELVAPDGQAAQVRLAAGGFARLLRRGATIGGVQRLPDRGGWAKLRLTLAPTARQPGPPPAPFGDWTIRIAADAEAELWVLRDDRDLLSDATAPRQPSAFVDPAWRRRDAQGAPVLDDAGAGVVRRLGTASVLTTARTAEVVGVAATVANPAGGTRGAAYSSRARGPETEFAAAVQVGAAGQPEGVVCCANGSAREVRLIGTSVAAALHARALAGLG